jgi:hypothetical protein
VEKTVGEIGSDFYISHCKIDVRMILRCIFKKQVTSYRIHIAVDSVPGSSAYGKGFLSAF